MVLHFTFKSVIHFELIFVESVRYNWILFFACGWPVAQTPFDENKQLVCYLCFCVEDQVTIFMWVYFWALYSLPLIYLSTFSPVLHCLDYL